MTNSLEDTTRHVAIGRIDRSYGLSEDWLIEVWTFDEWAKLSEEERPEDALILAGIGFLTFREPASRLERRDFIDLVQQATDAWYGTE